MTKLFECIGAFGTVLLLGLAYYDPALVPAFMERYMSETPLREGNLNTAIWDRGDWANFTLQDKKFHGPVLGCRWSPTLTRLQWAYGESANLNGRFASRYTTSIAWRNLVKAGKCVETDPVWYAVKDIRVTSGAFLSSFSPGQRHTAPGITKILIDGENEYLYVGVNIPLL